MNKTAREICIENGKESEEVGLTSLRKRYVEMLDALRIYNAKLQGRPDENKTRLAAYRVSTLISFLKYGNHKEGEVAAEGAGNHIYDYLMMIAETVIQNAEITEIVESPTYTYEFILPAFYHKGIVTDPKTSEYIKSFDFEARLAANVYRSMEDAKYTLWAMKDLFLIGWILGIDLDEEIIQLTKVEE